jgi:hypothetical protein
LATFGGCKPPGAVPWPTNWKAFVQPTLQILGVADWDELLVGAFEVCLDLEDDLLIINPTRTTEEGFAPVSAEKRIMIPSTSPPKAIGGAIWQALAACETGPPKEAPRPLEP